MKTILLTLGVLTAVAMLFILLSAFIIVCIAWAHRPISVWEMLKETIHELRRKQ